METQPTKSAFEAHKLRQTQPKLFHRQYILAALTLALGVGSHAINGFVSSAVLPDIISQLGGETRAYWVFSLFQVASILGGTLTGSLKQRFGAKQLYILATFILAMGSLVAGYASNLNALLLGRALQGFGEGIIIALSYAVIYELFPEKLVASVFAMLATVWAIAAAVGPVTAGYLTQIWSWRAAYLVNLPLTLILLTLALFVMPKHQSDNLKTDLSQALNKLARLSLLGFAILLLSYVAQTQSVTLATVIFISGLALLALTRQWDTRSENPLIPRTAFNNKRLIGAIMWVLLLDSCASAVRMVYGNALGRELWGLNISQSAYLLTILAFAWSISAWYVSGNTARENQFKRITFGTRLIALGLLTMAGALNTASMPLFALGLAISGAGYGFSNQFLNQVVIFSADEQDRDRATGFLPALASAGIAIGAAISSLLARLTGLTEHGSGTLLTKQTAIEHAPLVFTIMASFALLAAMNASRLSRLN
ncbi:MFS transporter [Polycladidibacter stylochi]|uniref:MFS transporter n=1 Tax=Polycladidibacter stylochi TaxID=1807766 RepID=UPI00083532ED|nr:MFS transporter [Pseudovibrio stylochi]